MAACAPDRKNLAHELRKKRLQDALGLIKEHIHPNFSNGSLENLTTLDEKELNTFFREHASQPAPNTIFWRLSIGPGEIVPLNITMLYNEDLTRLDVDARVFLIILNNSSLNDPGLEGKPGLSSITQTGIENFTLHHLFQLPDIQWESQETKEAKMFSGRHPDGRFFELRAGKDGSWSFLKVSHPANAPIKSL